MRKYWFNHFIHINEILIADWDLHLDLKTDELLNLNEIKNKFQVMKDKIPKVEIDAIETSGFEFLFNYNLPIVEIYL